MSYATIRKLLEVRVNTVGGAFPTYFENAPYTPVAGTPWQAIVLMPGRTENPTFGSAEKREVGVLQVMLYYPPNAGSAAALERAEVLRAGFARGLVLVDGAVRLLVLRSPYIGPAANDGAWYMVPVSVPYQADVS